jgi:citrate lyase beta subunit
MAEPIQPRRNLLFVPGTRPDRFAKALAAGPDMITVDLEDAVIPAHKDAARGRSMPLFDGSRADGIERVVRINGVRTPFGLKDLLAIVEHPTPPDGIMLPKVESADEVRIVDALLQRAVSPRNAAACAISASPARRQSTRSRSAQSMRRSRPMRSASPTPER